MTPKEKAEELIKRFYSIDAIEYKQCALIAVDNILHILWHTHKNESDYRFWQDVKKEIELL
jgi:hypothetical protein